MRYVLAILGEVLIAYIGFSSSLAAEPEPGAFPAKNPISTPAAPATTPDIAKPAAEEISNQKPWTVKGRVVDKDGRPFEGAEVQVATGNGTRKVEGPVTTDADGKYEVAFGVGPLSPVPWGPSHLQTQFALVRVQKDGYFEKMDNHQGRCVASLQPVDDEFLIKWIGVKWPVFLPDQPMTINFTLLPAASMSGKLIDEQNHPLADYDIKLGGKTMIVPSTKTDDQGRFTFKNLPTTEPLQIVVNQLTPAGNRCWAAPPLSFESPGQRDLVARDMANERLLVTKFALKLIGPGGPGNFAMIEAQKYSSREFPGEELRTGRGEDGLQERTIGEMNLRLCNRDPEEDDAPVKRRYGIEVERFAASLQNRWEMGDGVTMDLVQRCYHGPDLLSEAIIHWPVRDARPALRHVIFLAADSFGNREKFDWAWDHGKSKVWIVNQFEESAPRRLRVVDFSDPGRIVETDYDLCGDQGVDLPADVKQKLEKSCKFDPKLVDQGLAVPVGISESNSLTSSAETEKAWFVAGHVRDAAGTPLPGVLVLAYDEHLPPHQLDYAYCDDQGAYQLHFRLPLGTLAKGRGIRIMPKLVGSFERDLGASGEFTAKLTPNEPVARPFHSRLLVAARPHAGPSGVVNDLALNQPGQADFVMQPGAALGGVLKEGRDEALANAFVGLRLPEHRPDYYVTSTTTDKEGRFYLGNVPTDRPLQLVVAALNPTRESRQANLTFQPGEQRWLRLTQETDQDNRWQLHTKPYQGPVSTKVRIRLADALGHELPPPYDADPFASRVLELVASCRVDKTSNFSKPFSWSRVLTTTPLVHVVFDPPQSVRMVTGQERKERLVDEVVFQPSQLGPGGVMVKSGNDIYCLHEWTPQALAAIVRKRELQLDEEVSYRRLIKAVYTKPPQETANGLKAALLDVGPDGKLTLAGQPVEVDQLVKALKAAGYYPATTMVVVHPVRETPFDTFHWILWNLDRQGWPHFCLLKAEESEPAKAADDPKAAAPAEDASKQTPR